MAGSPDRWPIYRAAFREWGRAASARLREAAAFWRLATPKPDRLLLAPQDLRTSDPITAEDIAAGLFVFAGRTVQAVGSSPFTVIPPSAGWAEALYGFAWLRHLRAGDEEEMAARARALVGEAIGARRRDLRRWPASKPEIVARRVISFLAQSPLLLLGADHAFYLRYLDAIGRGVGQLGRDMNVAARPRARLSAAIAVAYAGLSCEGLERELARASRVLARELEAQVLADGVPLSRNPADLIELLLDLLPLRLLFDSRAVEPPAALDGALDRMIPMLRFFRHADGELALFNGMGRTPFDAVATILAHDEIRGAPPRDASPSGYHRVEAGPTVLLVDAGPPPPIPASAAAHAGCLAFELSSGTARMVVNCGAPPIDGPLRDAARRTAAHSTLSIGEASSATFFESSGQELTTGAARFLFNEFGPVVAAGPGRIEAVRRREESGHERLSLRHDGYEAEFGVLHERRLRLSPDGALLEGVDGLRSTGTRRRAEHPPVAVRFHLSPMVACRPDGDTIILVLPDAGRWRFSCEPEGRVQIGESISFAVAEGRRAARQIVVELAWPGPGGESSIAWRFERI